MPSLHISWKKMGIMLSKDSFFDLLQNRFNSLKERGGLLRSLREKAWDHFIELGLPEKSEEIFRYVPLGSLYQTPFKSAVSQLQELDTYIYPECKNSCIVLVDGKFSQEFSRLKEVPKTLAIFSLEEAMRTYGAFLQNRWHKQFREENDSFAILNTALYEGGVFIYAPPKMVAEFPIQILHLATDALTFPKIHIFAGRESKVDIALSVASEQLAPCFMNSALDLVLEDDSHVRLSHAFSLPRQAWYFASMRTVLKKGSNFQTIICTHGAQTMRMDMKTALVGQRAQVGLFGLSSLKGSSQSHTRVVVDHEAPHTHSNQHFKGVLFGNSQSSFDGNIIVRKEAQKTEAYQLNRNLVIGEHALAQSKPRLEIFADDVKASHGATAPPSIRVKRSILTRAGFQQMRRSAC